MTARAYTVDVIAGDGIGPEVMAAAVACVDAIAPALGFTMNWRTREWGSDHFREHGRMMPVDGLDQMATGDAILLGAVGDVDIPDDVTLWGLLIPIRREFEQYVNLRPVRLLPGVVSPLAGVSQLDLMVVRENVEGEYSEVGGRMYRGQPEEMAVQESDLHPDRCRAGRHVRGRARAATSRATHLRDEVQRDHPHHAVLGRGRAELRRRHAGRDRGERADRRARRPPGPQARSRSTSSSPPTSSATSSRTSRPPRPGRSAWRRAPTSTRRDGIPRCSNPFTGPRPTSRAGASPIPSVRSGPRP